MPGSGKTTLGKEVARRLNVPFVDLDREIEFRDARPIHEIFSVSGEDHFRKVERELLQDWISHVDNFVMATGGGTPCFHDNISRINESGVSFFLDVPLKELASRITEEERKNRPLLDNSEDLATQLDGYRNTRMPYYLQATHHLRGATNADAVLSLLEIKK